MGQGANPAGGGDTLGNCTIEAPEECDDCNLTSGDGCGATGVIEPGWVCKQEGLACFHFSGFVMTPAEVIGAGGPNGTAFDDACGPNQAIVGFDGSWDLNSTLKGLAAMCGVLAVTDSGAVTWTPGAPTPHRTAVGNTDLPPAVCAADEFVVGFTVNTEPSGGMQVRGADITCAKLYFDGSAIVRGAAHTLDHYGATGGPTASATCADGEIGIHHTGAAAGRYDKMGMTCATLVPTFCGDSQKEGFENCDDGNAVPGDGCSSVCQ